MTENTEYALARELRALQDGQRRLEKRFDELSARMIPSWFYASIGPIAAVLLAQLMETHK